MPRRKKRKLGVTPSEVERISAEIADDCSRSFPAKRLQRACATGVKKGIKKFYDLHIRRRVW